MKFTTTTKNVGKKTRFTVLCDGVEIGHRTSARPYRFALVVTRNQERELQSAKANLGYAHNQYQNYNRLALDPAAQKEEVAKARTPFERECRQKWIEEGAYAKWAVSQSEAIRKYEALIKHLSSGPQPEFDRPYVLSWHHQRQNVPNAPEWTKFVAVVEVV